ncbi:MAG TPA: hypothetical protein VFF37_07175 [Streptomyces sp.]|nr:hypothetical protein [Streptomyces sp.]
MNLPTSPTGWLALYRTTDQIEKKEAGTLKPVDGWSNDGDALVVHARTGQRVSASALPHFRGLREAEATVAGVLPGQGWAVAYVDGIAPDPVVAWTVDVHGWSVPLLANSEGYASPYEATSGDFLVPPGCAPESSPYRPS